MGATSLSTAADATAPHHATAVEGGGEPPPALQLDESWKLLVLLGRRYSMGPKYLGYPAPSAFALEEAAAVAARAPDHGPLRPVRFVQIRDEHRSRLGGLFAADAARRGHGAAEVERARERASNGPALLAVVAHVREGVEEVPADEQWITVGAATMNFLNALHVMGFGAKLLSGASVRAPEIQAAFCGPGETLVSWIVAGTPKTRGRLKYLEDGGSMLSSWQPRV